MKSSRPAFALLGLLAAGCATYTPPKNPPPPGPDVYQCIGSSGVPRYVTVRADLFQVWRQGDVWGPNACAVAGQSCTVDETGKIIVRQVIVMEGMPRTDLLFTYDLAAGVETQQAFINGSSTTPSQSACTPFTGAAT